jgi:LEA14-like dessication related protein
MANAPKIEKRLWITGLIGLISVTGAYMYYQVNKVLSYTLNFKGVKNVTFNNKTLNFTIWYEYTNKANINVTLADQQYEVYINGQYLTTLTNFVPNTLIGSQPSIIDVNVKLTADDFKKLKLNYAQLILAPKTVEIKTVMKWKVKYGIFKFPVTYPYILNLKEILGWVAPSINKL